VGVDEELIEVIASSAWLMRVIAAVRDTALPQAWVGAGVLRDLVWRQRYGPGFRPELVRDVDVAFFDPDDLSRAGDDRATARLTARLAGVPWEAKNQAAVHFPRQVVVFKWLPPVNVRPQVAGGVLNVFLMPPRQIFTVSYDGAWPSGRNR
jgi:hypothetical protein